MAARTAFAFSLVILLGAASVFLYGTVRAHRDELERELGRANSLNAEVEDLKETIALLQHELEQCRSDLEREQRLGNSAARIAESSSEAAEESTASVERKIVRRNIVIQHVGQADTALETSLQRADLRSLLLLAADLLAMGEPGYEKLIDLLKRLEKDNRLEPIFDVWSPELFAGEMIQIGLNSLEDLLRFGLYVNQKNDAELFDIKPIEALVDEEVITILLSLYQGDDPQILQGYESAVARQAQLDVADNDLNDETVVALAQLRTPSSEQLLVDLFDRAQPRRRLDIARALLWQGSPQAPRLLEELRQSEDIDQDRLAPLLRLAESQ